MGGGDRDGTSGSAQDVAARDDAHLRVTRHQAGAEPDPRVPVELRDRVQLHQRLDRHRSATSASASAWAARSFFWTWLIVIAGQFIVALVFAELASHFPVAGSIYQWSKRLSHRTLGWFTGWFYFWAQVVTVSAVAVIVAFVVDGSTGRVGHGSRLPRLPDRRSAHDDVHVHRDRHAGHHDADQRLRRPAAVDPQQHRRRDRDPRACSCSRSSCCSSRTTSRPSVLTSFGAEAAQNGNIPGDVRARLLHGRSSSCTASTPPGRSARRRVDASRQAPRGVLSSVLISGLVGVVFLLAVILALTRHPGHDGRRPRRAASRSRRRSRQPQHGPHRRDHGRRDLPVRHPRLGLRVHPGHPGRGDPDDVLDGPRPAPAARRRLGPRQHALPDAGQRGHRASASSPRSRSSCRPGGGLSISIAATG